jgi:hypothetical protein
MWTIPVSIGASIFGWISRNLHWILLGALVIVTLTFAYAKGRSHERDRWKPQVEALKAKVEEIRNLYESASERAEEERRADLERVRQMTRSTEENYEARIQASNARADSLLSELRRARAEGRLRPLAPSGAAPAPCRDYEADPTRLSDAHIGFLVGEARAGAACIEQLGTCSRYALGLHAICSGQQE